MPPYNFSHTITESIQVGAGDITSGALMAACRPALGVITLEAADEQVFVGELKELLTTEAPGLTNAVKLAWKSRLFQTLPDRYCSFGLPSDERYLVTSSWRAVDGKRYAFGYDVQGAEDLYINFPPWTWMQLRAPVVMGSAPAKVSTASQGTVKQTQRIHVVASGETLAKIAHRYQVTVTSIVAANVLRDDAMIFVGQRLVIP
jgi:N-acetylmuramoyl-L-alanine amidase